MIEHTGMTEKEYAKQMESIGGCGVVATESMIAIANSMVCDDCKVTAEKLALGVTLITPEFEAIADHMIEVGRAGKIIKDQIAKHKGEMN